MEKPIIGIVEWPYYDKDNDKMYEVMIPIVEWIVRSGGRPIGIFPTQIENFLEKRSQDIEEMTITELKELKESIMMCDAIIKPGATKIYPHESIIYDMVTKEDMPYLGICCGMQIMRNHDIDYIPNERNNSEIVHHSKDVYAHNVNIVENTKLHSILNKDHILVNSRHNFHVVNEGNKIVSAYATDGVIEALEEKNKLFNIGVQWHPELLPPTDENSTNLFGEFVESAKVYKNRK